MLCRLAAVIVLDVSFVQDRGAKRDFSCLGIVSKHETQCPSFSLFFCGR